MLCYRLRLLQKNGGTTPWHSDTLWGQLCWIYRDLRGDSDLSDLLQESKTGNVPFVVSDGFPTGFLPMPAGGSYVSKTSVTATKAQGIEQINAGKRFKKMCYLPESHFNMIVQGEKISLEYASQPADEIIGFQTHNSVARDSNTVLDGSLYQLQWLQPGGNGKLDVYVLVREDFEETLWECFDYMARYGFGGKVSIGLGAFDVLEKTSFCFPTIACPNCFITLSRCTPSHDMPINGQYKLSLKYGKLWHNRSRQGEPFKKPIVQLEPGAIFWGAIPEDGYCGCLVEGVAFDYPDTVQCGLSIAIPAKIEEVE